MLLSFAQFEREVTSERIRDKIGASKRRGLWVGGMVPLGYESRAKKLLVNEEEAERVRLIFRRYLELGSLGKLLTELRRRGLVTKGRHLSNGRTIGGIPFMRGPLAYLLRNRFYIGEVVYRGEVCLGQHTPILDHELFEAVQQKLAAQHHGSKQARARSGALLMGRLYDDAGNRMTPAHATEGGVRYRYYVSSALSQGRRAGSIPRVSAPEIESIVLRALRERYPDCTDVEDGDPTGSVDRIVLHETSIEIVFNTEDDTGDPSTLTVNWMHSPKRRAREIILSNSSQDLRPIRSETRAMLVRSIALGRRWLQEVIEGATVNDIGTREDSSKRHVAMMISLAFLAPDLVTAAIEGRLPRGIGVTRVTDAPIEWSLQREMLGL